MQKDSNTQSWTVPTFSKLLDYQTDSDPSHDTAVEVVEQGQTGANPTDFSILRGKTSHQGCLLRRFC